MMRLHAYSLTTDPQESDLIEGVDLYTDGLFKVVYTIIFQYDDAVREVAYWSTALDRWVMADTGYTFTDFTFYDTLSRGSERTAA